MPIVQSSTYKKRPFYLVNSHFETIVPSLTRKVEDVHYRRERIDTNDGDFLDIDWWQQSDGSKGVVILSHGLEGSSHRPYMKGMAKIFHKDGWDIAAWNCRTCSGEINQTPRLYHHADTHDLQAVIKHVNQQNTYTNLILIGFSMGGSMTLKFLGEQGPSAKEKVSAAVAISVPCQLGDSARELEKWHNSFYKKRFIKKLKEKLQLKAAQFPTQFKVAGLEKMNTFYELDEHFTAPLHGFKNADDFYQKGSSKNYLEGIQVPTLLINAKNDPFLPKSCYPIEICETHPNLHLEMPNFGGHVGFSQGGEHTWAEHRSLQFVTEMVYE